ncbi:MAG: glycogen synthase [Chloroflexi bacterium]|nr:glycogen synthase [Chloroflexota bacterium]
MKALLLTNEYPPNVYGGAGVHVDYMSRELAKLIEVEVRSFGDQDIRAERLRVTGFGVDQRSYGAPKPLHSVFGALSRCLAYNSAGVDADVVHCHTWYTHFGGVLARLSYGIPLVITIHSLEPLRPWKREQLGRGYDVSSWIEKTALEMADAIVAVSTETKADLLRLFDVDERRVRVIYNGIDLDEYRPRGSTTALERYGVDPAVPYVLFVGRITRQKGIVHLVRALSYVDRDAQIVLCAGAPDTPEIAREMEEAVAEVQSRRSGILWIQEMVPKDVAIELYSRAAVFCCPSIYEPFGIINLEAMACETAVVASAVGGIPEVVVHGETGLLVPVERQPVSPFEPVDPDRFSRDLASAINELLAAPAKRERFGQAGRRRAEAHFSWSTIARQTVDLYAELLARQPT